MEIQLVFFKLHKVFHIENKSVLEGDQDSTVALCGNVAAFWREHVG